MHTKPLYYLCVFYSLHWLFYIYDGFYFFAVKNNPSRRDLNMQDITNHFLKVIIELFKERIILHGRAVDIPFWILFYIHRCIEHTIFD